MTSFKVSIKVAAQITEYYLQSILMVGGAVGSGLMVSALDSGASAPGSSPGRGHCVLFLGKTRCLSHGASTQVYKCVPANLIQCFMLQKS